MGNFVSSMTFNDFGQVDDSFTQRFDLNLKMLTYLVGIVFHLLNKFSWSVVVVHCPQIGESLPVEESPKEERVTDGKTRISCVGLGRRRSEHCRRCKGGRQLIRKVPGTAVLK